MKNILRKALILMTFCLMMPAICSADTFKGKIVNAETGEILVGASISGEVNPQPGWSITSATETDSTGCFRLTSNTEGRILFTFSMIGYKNYRKVDYAYGREVRDTTDLGVIRLQPTALMLQEVEVTAKMPRITMVGDTIVFNPEAFKLKEGARLAELIKKLPGVESHDGKLFWNDKPIRLMMNGKDLFGGSQIIGELPAEVAHKLKLYDRKSELSRHTGNDDGKEDHVLDIQVKPGFLDKWYGELQAQYQTEKRYMFSVNASRLSDHDPQLIYGQANNANQYIDRTMTQSFSTDIDGDGKGQYGSYNYQHNWKTKGTGSYSNNRFDISASMGHDDGWNTMTQSTETFFPDKDRTFSVAENYHHTHKINPQLQTRLFAYTDSLNTITLDVKATYEKKLNMSEDQQASYGYDPAKFEYHTLATAMAAKAGDPLYERLITRNRYYQSGEQQERTLNISYSWQHFLGKKGSFTLRGGTNISGTDEDSHLSRNMEYLREKKSETLWQQYSSNSHDFNTLIGAELEYWLGSKVYLNITDNLLYSRTKAMRDIFADTNGENIVDGLPTTPDQANAMDNLMHKWTNSFTLKSTIKPVSTFMIMPKFIWEVYREKADYHYGQLDTTAVRNSYTYEPSVTLRWKMSRVRNMDLSFAYSTIVPDFMNTMGYRNTIDPLSITAGNPYLHESHTHTTTFNYHRMWLRKQIVLGLTAQYTKDINPIATLYRYNSSTGAYESMQKNVKGGDAWKFSLNYDQGLGVDFRLMNKFSVRTARSNGFLTIVDSSDPNVVPALNHQKNLMLDEDFNLSYETEKLEVSLYDRLQWNRYRYDDASYNTNPLFNRLGVEARLSLDPLEVWVDIADHYRSDYATSGMNGHKLISTAGATYKFCKNKCRLSLYIDDIFNKDLFYNTKYSAFQRFESTENYIHHYARLTFTYRFDAKANKKK